MIDEQRLNHLRRFQDRGARYEEKFLHVEADGLRLLAVKTTPLADPRPLGWVICHSFGIEQIHLGRVEVALARELAAAGYPVLRYSGRGYGDSEGTSRDIDMQSHLADATRMVEELGEDPEVEAVGVLGIRFGGLVAGIVADRVGAGHLALWEPILDGRRFMDQLFRYGAMSAIVGKKATHRPVNELKEALNTRGWADLGGLALTRRCYEQVGATSLREEMRTFAGRALIGTVTTTGEPGREARELGEEITARDGSVGLVPLKHLTGFGRFRYGDGEGKTVKVDTLHEVTLRMCQETVRWCRSNDGPA